MNILIKGGLGLLGSALVGLLGDKLYEKHHYDKEGYNALGVDREGYDRDGFNKLGYDRDGFNREGLDCEGFNKEGFDSSGYDRKGYDIKGYDREGYDRRGYDSFGYDKNGYDSNGFSSEGCDSRGYDRSGYNAFGHDRSGHDALYYQRKIEEINALAEKAHKQMKLGEFAYALRDIRVDAEKVLKCILGHWGSTPEDGASLNSMIQKCRQTRTLPVDMCEKLDGLRYQCNDLQHDTFKEKTYNEVHFCYMTLLETIGLLKEQTQ